MTEQNRESLKKFLAEEAEKQNRLKQPKEQVRQELENRARQAVEKYQQELEELTPLAKEKIGNIVQPWFNGLVQDGTYDQLLEWLRSHDGRDISVSDSILYYWPDKAFQGFEYSERLKEKPFEGNASFIVGRYEDYQQGIEKHQAGVDEVWSARFNIGGGVFHGKSHKGLYISQWPILGGGLGFAVNRSLNLRIPVDIENITAGIPLIHPEVWIGFADQVENGTALQVLQESLIPKPIRVLDVDSDVDMAEHAEFERRSHTRREEYLREKMARGK